MGLPRIQRKGHLLVLLVAACLQSLAHAADGGINVQNGTVTLVQDGDKWWFQSAGGDQFVSQGVVDVSYTVGYCPKIGKSEYHDTVVAKYGSRANWSLSVEKRFNAWGFNTLGAWSDKIDNLFYAIELGLSSVHDDWFSQEFVAKVDEKVQQSVRPEDPLVLGYFTANEVIWGGRVDRWPVLPREKISQLLKYLLLPTNSTGFQTAVTFLKDRYDSVADLNRAWRIKATSFDSVAHSLPFWLPSKARNRDLDDFMVLVARQFFQVAHDSIRKYDPSHLILGCRYSWWEMPDVVVQAEKDLVDVTTFNGYVWYPGMDVAEKVTKLYEMTGNPILIGEFSFRAFDAGLPNTIGAGWPVLTQKARARHFEKYVTQLMALPFAVGYHWWEYVDEPYYGRFDGENSNFGLVDKNDNPYELLVSTMTTVNHQVHALHRGETTIR